MWSDPNGTVPVEPLRLRYLELKAREGLTVQRLASRIGWTCVRNGRLCGDERRLSRALGLAPDGSKTSKNGIRYPGAHRTRIRLETAKTIAAALHLDVHEWDI